MESAAEREGVRPLTAEEEALKRNTDCVYFLASPLTCKKGSECEYRHSDGARVNPRDCWYWFNGSCLNSKCSFRHPPLDGLFGGPPTSGPTPPPPSQAPASAQGTAPHFPPYNTNKQSVPCYYFQKGNCMKGDKCLFMHGPQAAANPNPQQSAKVPIASTEPPQSQKKDSWGIKECQQQNVPTQQSAAITSADKPKANIDKPAVHVDKPKVNVEEPAVAPPTSAKAFIKAEGASHNVQPVKKSLPPYLPDDDLPEFDHNYLAAGKGYVQQRRSRSHQVQHLDDRAQNGNRDADEFLGESSPGFDVLVDNEDEDSGYLHNEDNFAGPLVNPIDDYDYHRSEYELAVKDERDRYNEMAMYDRLGRAHGNYELDRFRASPERLSVRERRLLHREADREEIGGSDLRHRLTKQRRLNGSRSALSPDGRGEHYRREKQYPGERRRDHHSRRNHDHPQRESSISTRLQGRIRLPRRSSPDRADLKERDRGRPRGRVSPVRPVDLHSRHQERTRKISEEFTTDGRNLGGRLGKRDEVQSVNFPGPKSLAELKGGKAVESSQEQPAKGTTSASKEQLREPVGSLGFEGPKPLSVILKRKREAALGNGESSGVRKEDVERDAGTHEKGGEQEMGSTLEVHKVGTVEEEEEEGLIPSDGEDINYDGKSSAKGDMVEAEDGVDAIEDQELENYDQRDGESDYEAMEGGDYKVEENAYPEDDDDLDDEDDFARKVGVMFS
ncbi:zinc finger CCCH domain-containing protein 32-like isoform X1 [Ananas comosus]|uniref:Zinc finger CCCH domain-containing protein 32-like isoform X1 n=1 Tax=Ananas comosus TaxID=4615 RepID=A0A6P5E912_ANACO|nr:zinc finger CCCH domain-containing protein 32-like isoform X1 [Ananas comosus]